MDNKFYNENKNLIHEVIHKQFPYLVGTKDYEDAFQEGSIGLINAIKQFDSNLNYKFSTYAYKAIKNQIKKNIYKYKSSMKISMGVYKQYIAYLKYENEGYSYDEIVEKLNTTPEKLGKVINAFNKTYLDEEIQENISLNKIIRDIADIENDVINSTLIPHAVTLCKLFLSEQELAIISYYYNSYRITEISNYLKISKPLVVKRIKKIEEVIFPIFREYLEGKIKFGKMCEKLIKHSKKSRKVLYLYFKNALENKNEDFLVKFNEILNRYGYQQLEKFKKFVNNEENYYFVKDFTSNLVFLLDKYTYEKGIEQKILKKIMRISGEAIEYERK